MSDSDESDPATVDSAKRSREDESDDEEINKKTKVTTNEGNGSSVTSTSTTDSSKDTTTKPDQSEDDKLSPEGGTLLVCGATNWEVIGRKVAKPPPAGVIIQNLYGPHRWAKNIRVRSIASACVACHSVLVTEDGKVLSWGRNETGQLGVGDTETKYVPTPVAGLEGQTIVQVAVGKGHTLFLNDQGVVFACGDNKMGQLGIGSKGKNELTPVKINYKGKPIVRMSCGTEFSIILDLSGVMFSFGCPEYGQLGHNSDGQMLEKAGRITYNCEISPRRVTTFVEKNRGSSSSVKDVVISDVKCGANHSVAFDTRGRVFTWGFAGYGRLGHSETKDEMVPRLVKQLENMRFQAKKVAAGSTFCLASDNNKMLYLWGQTKPSGEAIMYPKPVQDLCGWNIRSIACANKSIVIAADSSVISWGPSPTYGELGYGENRQKTSTTPQEVKPLEGIYIKETACGYAHTLMIARDETPEERKLISKLPAWT